MTKTTGHHHARRRLALGVVAVGLLTGALVVGLTGNAAASVVFAADFEDGDTSAFQLAGGHWTLSSDGSRVLRQTRSGAERAVASHEAPWTTYTVSARVKATSLSGSQSAVGLVARHTAVSGYELRLSKGNGIELARVIGTDRIVLASQAGSVRTSTWYELSFTVVGGQLTATVAGPGTAATLSISDATMGTGGIALFTERAAATFDDVIVDSLVEPDSEPPSAIPRLQLLEVTPTTATLTWPASTDNVGVTGYIIYHGGQFYEQREWLRVSTNAPVTVPLLARGALLHFAVQAIDAAGNLSTGARVEFPAPPTFPKSGDDTQPPTAPGAPVLVSTGPDGNTITWSPATDNIGVVEYHIIQIVSLDEVRVAARLPGTVTTALVPRGAPPNTVSIVAIDASWNRTSGPRVALPWQTGPPPQSR